MCAGEYMRCTSSASARLDRSHLNPLPQFHEQAGLNAKLNILLLLDALLLSIVDPVGHAASCNATQAQASAAYLAMALRDLQRIVDAVVPDNRADAVRLNATSTQKVRSLLLSSK